MRKVLAALAVAAAMTAPVSTVQAADMMAAPPPMIADSVCFDTDVLGDVESQFEYGAPRMLRADLSIVEFSNLQERGFLPRNEERLVERHYCQGTVLISDGQYRTVYYVVEDPMGFASMGRRAEGCVLGLDAWHVYGAGCQSLRRF
ncbi:hypothetical protein [Consotaella aegiceratis]|uniref:hypothetical protein n=1 Tax=Consotaella aegiceratis TaxID=3097961 RepID=UPI002F40ED1C